MRLWRIGVNFYSFSMNVDIDARDNHPFPPASPERERWRAGVAIMAFPNERLSFFDVEKLLKAQNTVSWPPAPLPARRAYRPEGRAYASERIRQR